MYRYCLFALCVLVAGSVQADVVYLKDGGRLVGEIVQVADGKVKIATKTIGDQEVDIAQVTGFSTDKAVNVKTADGEVKVGALKFAEGKTAVAGAKEGDAARPVAVTNVKSVWKAGTDSPELAAAKPKWTVRAQAGLNGQTGNKEITNFNGGIVVKRTVPDERLGFYARGRFSREDSVRSANEVMGGVNYEKDIHEDLFGYGKIELEFDEFENLDLRATASVGLGYFLIRKDKHEKKIRAGLGYQHESFDTGNSTDTALLELGLDYMIELNDYITYTHSSTYYPTFNELSDYRATMENAVTFPISKDEAWKVKIGIRNEFDDQPQPGVDRLDTYYFVNFVWDLLK